MISDIPSTFRRVTLVIARYTKLFITITTSTHRPGKDYVEENLVYPSNDPSQGAHYPIIGAGTDPKADGYSRVYGNAKCVHYALSKLPTLIYR